jgi:hypothetical protein
MRGEKNIESLKSGKALYELRIQQVRSRLALSARARVLSILSTFPPSAMRGTSSATVASPSPTPRSHRCDIYIALPPAHSSHASRKAPILVYGGKKLS